MPNFPGTTIQAGSTDAASVTAIQQRLNDVGCGPIAVDGQFGADTFAAVELFQARSFDSTGQPLQVDGKVGPATWSVLFGPDTVVPLTPAAAPTPLLAKLLEVAASQVGVMEVPLGSNRGPQVDIYIHTTGLDPVGNHYPWCACFVYWCFATAATALGVPNPCVKKAAVFDQWNDAAAVASAVRILPAEAQAQPSRIVPGTLFLLRTSSSTGHMGIVVAVQGNVLTTIEGNTNEGGSSEGIGVFRRTTRTIAQITLGFVLYA